MNEDEKSLFRDIYNFVYETAAAKSVPDAQTIMEATVVLYEMHKEDDYYG